MSISIHHLSKAFEGKEVLTDFSCELPARGVVAVMGRSGAGKTTLMNLLLNLTTPDSGEIRGLDGLRMAAVFQEDRLFEQLTVRENLRLTTRRDDASITQTLTSLGLDPENNAPVADYSGGMKRRVALARGALFPSEVLLLDEPFRGLDAATRTKAIDYLRSTCRDRLMILVTHDREEALELGAEQWIYIGGFDDEPIGM